MPSKRTNDSVDRIIEELNQRQAAEGLRAGVNDQQVDEILRSISLRDDGSSSGTVSFGPLTQGDMPTVALEGLDATVSDLNIGTARPPQPSQSADFVQQNLRPAVRPASEPDPPRQTGSPAPRPAAYRPKPAPSMVTAPLPRLDPVPAPALREEKTAPVSAQTSGGTTVGDTIIKKFLRQAVSDGDTTDSTAFVERKDQFKKFFEKSVAVVPDENGKIKIPESGKKRRGLFGFGGEEPSEDTGEFVPINISMKGKTKKKPAEIQPDPDDLDEPLEEMPAHAAAAGKKKKRGLFGRGKAEEDLYIPEPREETVTSLDITVHRRDPAPAQPAEQPEAKVYHSKYASLHPEASSAPAWQTPPSPRPSTPAPALSRNKLPVAPSADIGGQTLTADQLSALRSTVTNKTNTKKKPDTVEFTPGQESHAATAQREAPAGPAMEPAAEPIMTPTATVKNPPPAPRPEPVQPPAMEAPARPRPALDAEAAATATVGFSVHMDAIRPDQLRREISTGEIPPEVISAAADEITRTITGQIRLGGDAPVTADDSPTIINPAQRDNAPTTAFAADLGGAGITDSTPAEPDTSAFVRGIAKSINSDAPSVSRFAEQAERLTEDLTAADLKKPHVRGKIRLSGQPADETDDEGEIHRPFADAVPGASKQGYDKAEDAPAVRRALDQKILGGTIASIVAGIAALVLLYLGTAAASTGIPIPDPLDPLVAPGALLGVCLVLLAAACGACWQTLFSGFRGIVRSPTPDTLPTLAATASLVQLIAFLIKNDWYKPEGLCLLAGPAALLLCFNSIGKMLDARTVRANFDLVSAGVDHAVAYRLRESRVVHAVTRGLSEPEPSVLVSRPTVLLKSFITDSYSHRTSDKNQQQFAWVLGGCALLSLIFNLVWSKDPGKAVTAMAAVLCLGAPLAGTLLSALPARLMQRSAARVGAVIPGWKDIRQLGRTNVVQISGRDLFPPSCIKLHGIKTFRKERIDLAIVYAASVLVDASPTLRNVFLGMIGDNRKLLYKVDDLLSIPGKGCVGWIDGSRVLVGNRRLMEKYDIQIPAEEYEQRFTVNQRKVIYLAVAGNLFSMFLVGYERDNDTAAVIENLHHEGVSFIVSSDDFNCDVSLVEAVYTLPAGSVKVLNAAESDVLAPATAWLPESEGCMLHLGNFASFVGGLEAASGAAEGERKAGFVLTASVLISCVLAVIMSIAGGIVALPLPAMVLYQAGWAALALIFPMIQKY